MVIAGLIADGVTEVTNIEHIDRGYPHIENKFKALGADIVRVSY
jgi:UDP-N-acetylglucosamine 1-carboxyvinyltransferase